MNIKVACLRASIGLGGDGAQAKPSSFQQDWETSALLMQHRLVKYSSLPSFLDKIVLSALNRRNKASCLHLLALRA